MRSRAARGARTASVLAASVAAVLAAVPVAASAATTISFSSGVLTITGDDGANRVVARCGTGTLRLIGAGKEPISGAPTPPCAAVTSIVADMRAGRDVLELEQLRGATADIGLGADGDSATIFAGTVRGGSGDDFVELDRGAVHGGPDNDRVTTRGATDVYLDEGDDTLTGLPTGVILGGPGRNKLVPWAARSERLNGVRFVNDPTGAPACTPSGPGRVRHVHAEFEVVGYQNREGRQLFVEFGDLSGLSPAPARFEIVNSPGAPGMRVDASAMNAEIPLSATGGDGGDRFVGGPARDSFKGNGGRDTFDGGGCDGRSDFFHGGPWQGSLVQDTVYRYPGEDDVFVAERKVRQLAFVDVPCAVSLVA